METVVHNIRDLNGNARSAAEQLVGHALRENQKLVIQVVNIDVTPSQQDLGTVEAKLPEWCNVYEGLSDEEIDAIEEVILDRSGWARPTP